MMNKVSRFFPSITLLSFLFLVPADQDLKHDLKKTLEVSNKRLNDSASDHKKLGALAVSFVAKINGLEIDEDFWPQIASFIKDLDAKFAEASAGQEKIAKVSEAIDELKQFLKQGEDAFSKQPELKKTDAAPEDSASKDSTKKPMDEPKPMQIGKFDLDDFVGDAKDDCKLVSDAEEFKFIAESMSEIMQEKKLNEEERVKFVEFLSENFTPLAVEYGVDSETKDLLVKLYQKFDADLPELKLLPKVNARTPEDDAALSKTENSKEPSNLQVTPEMKKHLQKVFGKIKEQMPFPQQAKEQSLQDYVDILKKHVDSLHRSYQEAVKNL